MTLWKRYYSAIHLDDALAVLSETVGDARLIAGGTDLLIDLQQGRQPEVETLVDISNVPELNCLEVRGNRLFVGAAVTLNRIINSEIVHEHAQAIEEACRLIGGPQIRNVATLGGNVAHALPGADGTIALLSLNAIAEIWNIDGFHEQPIGELFAGPGKSTLNPKGEIISGFYITCRKPGQASSFDRVMRPQGVALPILNIAIWLERVADVIRDIHIALGPSGPVPKRAFAAEDILREDGLSKVNVDKAHQAILHQLIFRSSPYRASSEYRRQLSEVLFRNVIRVTFDRSAN